MPHEGGQRFAADSVAGRDDAPGSAEGCRTTRRPARRQEGRGPARPARPQGPGAAGSSSPSWPTSADGSTRDVTRLTVFSSSDPPSPTCRQRPGRVQAGRRGRHPVPLPRRAGVGPAHLPGAARGLRLDEPAGGELRRQARLRQAEDAEHPAVATCAPTQEFVRRAYLDLCGILPTPDEVEPVPRRQAPRTSATKLIDALLERPEYADFWALKWSDVLRCNRKTIQVKGTHVFQHWLRDHIAAEHAASTRSSASC